MPFFIISIVIQVLFVIHIVKTGRSTTWIWIVLMLPMAGAIAYLILEVLPDITNSKSGRKAGRKVQSVVNPNKDINAAAKQYSMNDSVENTMKLAEECLNKNLYSDAKSLYQKCLDGFHNDDPYLMLGLAQAHFGLNEFDETKSILDRLIEENPDFKNQDAHLLYARALENLGEGDAALHEYETLYDYFTGPDASYYFAKFLQARGESLRSKEIFSEIVDKAKHANSYYRNLHGEIIRLAKQEL